MFLQKKKSLIIATVIVLFFACEDIDRSAIPDSPVYLERNINAEAIELRTIGGYKTYPSPVIFGDAVGYGGLVVIYGFNEQYYAFDLACPNEVDREVRAMPNDAGQAVCESCGSVFSIGYGSGNRLSGPATEGLRRYNVSVSETVSGTILRVTR